MICLAGAATVAHAQTNCNAPAAQPITYVEFPSHPFGIVPSADGCWLFVSLSSANPRSPNGVAVLKRSGGAIQLQRIVPVENGPSGMVLTHDGQLLIAADDEFVVFLDANKLRTGDGDPVLGYMRDGKYSGSTYVNVDADDKYLFVSDEDAGTITVTDLEKARRSGFNADSIVGRIPTGQAPIALTFSLDGKLLYTTSEAAQDDWKWPVACKTEDGDPADTTPKYPDGAVVVVDVEKARTDPAHAVISRVPAGCSPVRLAIMPDGKTVWVTVRNNNAVAVFDAAKLVTDPQKARIATVPVGQSPVGIIIVDSGKRVIATNSNRFAANQNVNQTLNVLDPERLAQGAAAVLGTIPAGLFPRELAPSADGKTLFLSNYNSNNIEVIDLARLLVQSPEKN